MLTKKITTKLQMDIMEILINYVRSHETCNHVNKNHCYEIHRSKILTLIHQKKPIYFILPAFPAKSANSKKTAGTLPDLGEYLSLQFLNNLCKQIQAIYPYGAHILICSDGRVFNDLVLVSDLQVDHYSQQIKKIIKQNKFLHLSTFSLDDCFQEMEYPEMRKQLMDNFGESLVILKNKIKTEEESTTLFNGIHRFIFEDQLVHFPSISKNQIRNQSKQIAYEVMLRSNAWSNLLKHKFPFAIRLSIHPQYCSAEKFGIMLLKSKNVWATPWHRVVLKQNNQYLLVKKNEAEALKAVAIFVENQFSHYVIEG